MDFEDEEEEAIQAPDVYNSPESFVEEDEISNSEAGFMMGYNDA